MPFSHCISSFEGTSFKICKIQPPDLLFLCYTISLSCHEQVCLIRYNSRDLPSSPIILMMGEVSLKMKPH